VIELLSAKRNPEIIKKWVYETKKTKRLFKVPPCPLCPMIMHIIAIPFTKSRNLILGAVVFLIITSSFTAGIYKERFLCVKAILATKKC